MKGKYRGIEYIINEVSFDPEWPNDKYIVILTTLSTEKGSYKTYSSLEDAQQGLKRTIDKFMTNAAPDDINYALRLNLNNE